MKDLLVCLSVCVWMLCVCLRRGTLLIWVWFLFYFSLSAIKLCLRVFGYARITPPSFNDWTRFWVKLIHHTIYVCMYTRKTRVRSAYNPLFCFIIFGTATGIACYTNMYIDSEPEIDTKLSPHIHTTYYIHTRTHIKRYLYDKRERKKPIWLWSGFGKCINKKFD